MDKDMLNITINLIMDDSIRETSSAIQVYVNDIVLAEVSTTDTEHSFSILVASDNAKITIRRKYYDTTEKEEGVIKKVISGLVLGCILAYATIAPFECIYECEEVFCASGIKEDLAITFRCKFDMSITHPQFIPECEHCDLKSQTKRYFLSAKELSKMYVDRKNFIYMIDGLAGLFWLMLLFFSCIAKNIVTLIFASGITGLIICFSVFSLANLQKKYKALLNQAQ